MQAQRKFKIGTTSFIIPDHIVPNVRLLGPFFDEIELLIFESQPEESIPSKKDVKTLLSLSRDLDVAYNIHLPTDVSLCDASKEKRQIAADRILFIMDRLSMLCPSSHTLHLEMDRNTQMRLNNQDQAKKWIDDARDGLERFLSRLADVSLICVETLDYPFEIIAPLVEDFNLGVCIDAGHHIKYGYDFLETYSRHRHKTSIIHLHGVDFSCDNPRDHSGLDKLPDNYHGRIEALLNDFLGTLSLEVFNKKSLNRSLNYLSKMFQNIPFSI